MDREQADGIHDVIGFWSEIKLEIIEKYLPAYTTILSKQKARLHPIYIDAFAGSGKHLSEEKKEFVKGSPARALDVQPPFERYHFIDLDARKIGLLEELAASRSNVSVHQGDCNTVLIEKIFRHCRWEDYARAVCLLDPYSLQLDWKVLETAGRLGTVEIFLNFPILDINRNAVARDIDKERPKRAELTRFWGDETWVDAAYSKEASLFGDIMFEKTTAPQFVEAFRSRLRHVAGFGFVPEPLPMRNRQRGLVYYLFFASPNKTGGKIVKDIFDSYRRKGYR